MFSDTLDAIKFICKDVWAACWDKQIDNLRTNHRVCMKKPVLCQISEENILGCLCPPRQCIQANITVVIMGNKSGDHQESATGSSELCLK